MAKGKALGKGIEALLGKQIELTEKGSAFQPQQPNQTQQPAVEVRSALINEIPLDEIVPNPSQPRSEFDEEKLQELAESIMRLGIIQPITVRAVAPHSYQIISGERRYRASKMANLSTIPAYVRTADDQETLEMALIENIQRDDLNSIDIAISYQRLVTEFSLTQEVISTRVGKKRSTVANYLRLLNLPDEIQLAVKNQVLSMGHARTLVSVADEALQKSIAEKIVTEGLSVRQAEELVKQLTAAPVEPKGKPANTSGTQDEEVPETLYKLAESMEKCFNGAVSVKHTGKGAAKITLEIKDADLAAALDKLSLLL